MTGRAASPPVTLLRRLVVGPSVSQWGAPVGLAGIWLVMAALNPRFLSPVNLTNLVLQTVGVGTIAIGVVLVLLVGELDLSVGAVSGLGAGVVAVLSVNQGWPAAPALVAGLATGVAVGVVHGVLLARVGIPSLVVTLGGLLVWHGALLAVLGDTGTVNLTDPALVAIAGSFLTPAVGWGVAGAVVLAAIVVGIRRWETGERRGRRLLPPALLATGALGAVAVFNADRGVPVAGMVFLVLLLGFDLLVRRTRLGRHAVAVGSDADAARRAGIPIDRVRVAMLVLASVLAVTGGVIAASRLLAVNQSSGSTDLMLTAVAAAAIGGTSLFGGRGSVFSALLGALVVGSMANGLDLLGVSASLRSVATGVVLLTAVGLDAVSRRALARRSGRPGP